MGEPGSPYDSDHDGLINGSTTTKNASTGLLSNGPSYEEENKFQSAISAWRSMSQKQWMASKPGLI